MSVAQVQPTINAALAIIAQTAGDTFSQYRPNGVTAPIVSGNLIGTLLAWMTTDPSLKRPKQSVDGKPDWYGGFDPTNVQVGDYLVGDVYATAATFFVQAIERLSAPHLIRCNRVVSMTRMQANVTPGLQPNRGGDEPASGADTTAVLSGWPASVLSGTRSGANAMQLPSDTKLGTVSILLPPSLPASIFANDTVIDDLGNRFGISSAELGPLGWRLTADQWKPGA